MTGLYGLELRAVTAALERVGPAHRRPHRGARRAGRGGGRHHGAGDGDARRRRGHRPGRAAAGAGPGALLRARPPRSPGVLRHTRLAEGVVIEVGGTSTNVAAIKDGRPALSYVQVASHATAVRALDVRVIGVAGGSMLRARKGRLYGVGPRSAHIAGLPVLLLPARRGAGRGARRSRSRRVPTTRADYVALRLADGVRGRHHQHLRGGRARRGRARRPRRRRRRRGGRPSRVRDRRASRRASTATSWRAACSAPPPTRSARSPWRSRGEYGLEPPDHRRGRGRRRRPRPLRRRARSGSRCTSPSWPR